MCIWQLCSGQNEVIVMGSKFFHYICSLWGGSNPTNPQGCSVGPLQKLPAMQRLDSCVWYAWVDSCRQAGPRGAAHSRAPLKRLSIGMQGNSRTGQLTWCFQGNSASGLCVCPQGSWWGDSSSFSFLFF